MPLSPGTRLGAFEIVTLVGAGGMGEVYSARDTRLNRTVAIKVLSDSGADSLSRTAIARFRQEARAIARLAHPNICTLHDFCEEGATTFLVMELVEGTTLARRLETGALPPATAIAIAIQIADALDHAHHQGVIHRDLKPSNIVLARDRVKLLDFGLAKLREADDRVSLDATQTANLTDVHTIVGTVPYMAPEHIEGRTVDPRTDIFSFGVVLYEMVAGRRPFAGESRVSLMAAIVTAEPPSLAELQPLASPSLERVVRRCLAKDPENRWQTARDLAEELRWIADGSDTSLAIRTQPRRRVAWVTGTLGAAAGAAAVAALAYLNWPRAPTVPVYTEVTFRRGMVSSARFTPDGRTIVYAASWDGEPYEIFLAREGSPDSRPLGLTDGRILSISSATDMAVVFGRQTVVTPYGRRMLARVPLAGGARQDLLEGVIDADWIPGTNDLAVVRVAAPNAARVEFPIGHVVHEAPAVWSLRVSPDGQRVAFLEGPTLFGSTPEGMVTVIDRAGRKSTPTRGWAALGLAWTPSADEIWFTATGGSHPPSLHGVSLSGAVRGIDTAPDWLVLYDISRDGRVLLTRNTIRIAMACQVPGESAERDLTWLGGSRVRDVSADGRLLLFTEVLGGMASGSPTVFLRETSGTPAIRLGTGAADAISPDGKWALAWGPDRSWTLLPTGAGAPRTLDKGGLARAASGGWLPDGLHVVFTGWETGKEQRPRIYLQAIDEGAPRAITPEGVSTVPRNAATPDGHAVLGLSDKGWQLFPVVGGDPRPVPALKPEDAPLQWSADGATVYAETNLGVPPQNTSEIVRIDLETGQRTPWKTLAPADRVGIDGVMSIAITPDARAYCYSYVRRLGTLFTVDGLK